MTKPILDFKKGLSIHELEERFELTVVTSSDALEAAKDDDDKCYCLRCD